MSTKSTSVDSQTDWDKLKAMTDDEIDLSEVPEVTAEQLAQSTLRVGGKAVARDKVRINIYLDTEVVEYFKAAAGGRGYQTLINEALRERMWTKGIEAMLRRVIREEMTGREHE